MDKLPVLSDERRKFIHDVICVHIPFNRVLGLEVVEIAAGAVIVAVPFRDELIGDPIRPALHGGVISAVMDACGGAAVWTSIGKGDRVSTIDLRVDYLRPAPLETMEVEARVLRVGNRVGVTSMRVYARTDPHTTLAEGKGVYAIKRVTERESKGP